MIIKANNPLLVGASGRIGDYVIVEMEGKIVFRRNPGPRAVTSKAQRKNESRFKKASAFAQELLKDPEIRADYEKRCAGTSKAPYHMALKDCLNAAKAGTLKF